MARWKYLHRRFPRLKGNNLETKEPTRQPWQYLLESTRKSRSKLKTWTFWITWQWKRPWHKSLGCVGLGPRPLDPDRHKQYLPHSGLLLLVWIQFSAIEIFHILDVPQAEAASNSSTKTRSLKRLEPLADEPRARHLRWQFIIALRLVKL